MLRTIFSMSYYAVRRGRTPGIYRDWESCKAQVLNFSGARYKKFGTQTEAQEFIDDTATQKAKPVDPDNEEGFVSMESIYAAHKLPAETVPLGAKYRKRPGPDRQDPPSKRKRGGDDNTNQNVASSSSADDVTKNKAIDVYTDGACVHNGKQNAKAAIGVFWGVDHPMNVSERLPGRQTNNRAEIHAARKAIEQAKSMGRTHVRLFTDSQFLINSMTKWVKNWEKNGWRLISGQPVINREDFEQMKTSSKGMKITWIKVAGHAGIFGNEWADQLAVAGLKKPLPNGDS